MNSQRGFQLSRVTFSMLKSTAVSPQDFLNQNEKQAAVEDLQRNALLLQTIVVAAAATEVFRLRVAFYFYFDGNVQPFIPDPPISFTDVVKSNFFCHLSLFSRSFTRTLPPSHTLTVFHTLFHTHNYTHMHIYAHTDTRTPTITHSHTHTHTFLLFTHPIIHKHTLALAHPQPTQTHPLLFCNSFSNIH